MKQIIYLDTDRIKSLVAQVNNGVEDSYQKSTESERGSEKTEKTSISGEVKGGFKIPGIAELGSNILGNAEDLEKIMDNKVVQEIHNIQIHDSMFDSLINYLTINKEFVKDYGVAKTGSFIKGIGVLQIFDFEYLEGLFKENSFISYLKKSQEDNIRNMIKEEQNKLPREQRRKNENEINKYTEEAIKENNKQYTDIEQIIKAIKYIVPYKRMALSDEGFLIPLDDRCFRDVPELLGLKYGGEFQYVGYITNIIEDGGAEDSDENIFKMLQDMINQVLFGLLPIKKKKLFIIHPLGLYLES